MGRHLNLIDGWKGFVMDVIVSGRNIEIGQALNSYISDTIKNTADKYFGKPIDAAVTVSRNGSVFHVECQVHAIHGVNLHSHAEDADVYSSFDLAAEKLEKQLRRLKRKIKNHHDSTKSPETS